MPLLPPSANLDSATESFIDAFYYSMHPLEATMCAAHVDPGIVTVIAHDSPGLEVCNARGEWETLELGSGEVAIVVGRSWEKLEHVERSSVGVHHACTHRVRALTEGCRCSVAFEIR